MKKEYYVAIKGERIPVSEDVYRAFKQLAWREHKRRASRAKAERSLDLLMEDGFDIVADSEPLSKVVSDRMLIDALLLALAELTDSQRRLIDAVYCYGLSERAIAEHYGVSQQAISKRKRRVLKILREMLSSHR